MSRVLLVTGGSRGIGAATALLAAADDCATCVNYVSDRAAAEALVERIRATGGRAIAVQADVSREDEVERLFRTVDATLGRLTALVNSAGVLETQMPLESMTAERLERVFRTNVTGTFLCCREAVRRMSKRHGYPGGAIVNVSSAAARTGSPGEYVDYAASKGAIDTLTVGLAREVAADGIRVNAVRPAIIRTDIHAAGGEPGRVDRLMRAAPMRRGGEPEEVARAILWLLSDAASFSTGTFIDVSGGL